MKIDRRADWTNARNGSVVWSNGEKRMSSCTSAMVLVAMAGMVRCLLRMRVLERVDDQAEDGGEADAEQQVFQAVHHIGAFRQHATRRRLPLLLHLPDLLLRALCR